MSWRWSDKLVELSREPSQYYNNTNRRASAVDGAPGVSLPEDEASSMEMSRTVFDRLAVVPSFGPDREPKMHAYLMEEAMNACGLDGKKYAKMYAASKWDKGGAESAMLDLAEFQAEVERYSRPLRLQHQIRRRLDEFMAESGLRFVYAVDEVLRTDLVNECTHVQEKAPESRKTAMAKETKDWDEFLYGSLADLFD